MDDQGDQMSTDQTDCINGDIPFEKQLILEGTGDETPLVGSLCTVTMTTVPPDALCGTFQIDKETCIEMGYNRNVKHSIVNNCLTSMREGEISEFTINHLSPKLCTLKIHLHNVENFPQESYRMSFEQKLTRAKFFKERGVESFKKSEFQEAFSDFSKAIKLLIFIHQWEESVEEIDSLKCHCYLNLAACQLKYPTAMNYVIENCDKALLIDDTKIKGYLRRGQAYMAKGDYSQASLDFRKALEIEPNNRFVHSLLRKTDAGKENVELKEN